MVANQMSTNNLLLLTTIAARQRALEEEEEMTHYTQEDLDDEWEFKFVRSMKGDFRKTEVLKALLEEEAKYGWILLEKFDDRRIRLKRRRSTGDRDDRYISQGEDPYRTYYGTSPQKGAIEAILYGFGFVVVVVAILFLIFLLTGMFDY
jgi:hypothetical protein